MTDEVSTAPARTRNRWGEGERLRGEILAAASTLLSGLGGEDGLTIRGVARAAGIAPASIYQHFADRAALVRGLREHEFARLRTLMCDADARPPEHDVVARVREQLHAYCTFAVGNPGHYRLMLAHRDPAAPRGPLMDVIAMLTEAFERCADAGHALRLPADRAAVIVFVGAHGRVALLHSNPSERSAQGVPDFVDELVGLVFA
ncbi:AcrR family transcriptional regulator [Amycolatopsis bartoniae]|uniref:TetR family transcriptional regulator n=1 Tax=Amycolatopsis bartoniae TaxID=941986 RepID=A0A8H9IWM0_9PSEU|nr:TetR/AcrR family transcriptional regulator [Amycolatopsis bartoniae]MBB2936711.1 AcrR family transcriptional regulator [Amycolatopsis bartoniae]GHF49641.1 TetR family transcriptional regulator [Amycolatopsis bartoniae]